VFQKVIPPSLSQQGQARVDFFIKEVLPQIERQKQTHTLIYIPSYFDFCVVRNALLKRDVSFVSVTEYSRTTEVGRGRARFLQGRKPIMLYTGRAHFFYRHAIKGIKHLIFLGVPEHSGFYSDQVNLIDHTARNSDRAAIEDGEAAIVEKSSCLTLFTKYEAHALERVVGSNNCSRMIGGIKTTFMFYT
jgi:U3 small nucleolar RNA-associated protein 25